MHEPLDIFRTFRRELGVENRLGDTDDEIVLRLDARYGVVHGVDLVGVEPQRVAAVNERVRMNRLFVRVSQ